MKRKGKLQVKKGNVVPFGVTKTDDGIQFTKIVPKDSVCKLLLYEKGKKEATFELLLGEEFFTGRVCSIILSGVSLDGMEYCYEVDGKKELDPYTQHVTGREHWASKKWVEQRGRIEFQSFDWEDDSCPHIPYNELILYQLHMRGFTKHISSDVQHRGTFLGLQEKIPYLKKLGINGILCLPIYEFEERMNRVERKVYGMPKNFEDNGDSSNESLVNYWGYTKDSNYFAPKVSYAVDKENPDTELKTLIKQLHQNKIEFMMDMFFEVGTNTTLILDCLRHWIINYHVDGFRVNDNVVPISVLASDPIIGSVKLLATSQNNELAKENYSFTKEKLLAEFNDGFMIDIRKFLKGDEGQVNPVIFRMKRNPDYVGVINYITNINSFTLADLVSYDIKHNEKNGEEGRDGTDYNYSWNCGVEGKTRKKAILSLRKKQMKNALFMLFLSQGTPMLLAGDEFENSQDGNNNPYCQDNGISWLNWKNLEKNSELFELIQQLIQLRKNHPMFQMKKELRGMDYASLGYPDISFHGTKAWYLDDSNYSRVLGVMLYGNYATSKQGENDCDFYIAFNMHWESHRFDLPYLNGKKWEKWIDTSEEIEDESMKENRIKKQNLEEKEKTELGNTYLVNPRSIVVFQSKKCVEKQNDIKKRIIERKIDTLCI